MTAQQLPPWSGVQATRDDCDVNVVCGTCDVPLTEERISDHVRATGHTVWKMTWTRTKYTPKRVDPTAHEQVER